MGWNMPGKIGNKEKLELLKDILASEEKIALAYSGGMDSAFLLWCLTRFFDRSQVWAVNFVSEIVPKGHFLRAIRFAKDFGARMLIIPGPEMHEPDFIKNDDLRCYHCKKGRLALLETHNLLRGFRISDGTQYDDLGQHRPGRRASEEHGVFSPLLEAGIGKEDIRRYAKDLNLPIADMMPESCLATRVASGVIIDPAHIAAIDNAEYLLKKLGFKLVRVRTSIDRARLEFLPQDIDRARGMADQIIGTLADIGWYNVDERLNIYGGL